MIYRLSSDSILLSVYDVLWAVVVTVTTVDKVSTWLESDSLDILDNEICAENCAILLRQKEKE